MKNLTIGIGIAALAVAPFATTAQDKGTTVPVVTISREEYLLLKKIAEEYPKLAEEMKAFKAKTEETLKKVVPAQAETDQALDELDKKLNAVKKTAKDSYPGSTKFMLAGYGAAGFDTQNRGGDKKFYASFNPIFLWKLNDRLLFEGELEYELGGNDTSTALEMAQMSYVLNDYMTIGAGKFLNPVNYFVERQHMAWVNKLPNKPLAVYDGLLPESNVGAQVRGVVPIGSMKLSYAFYGANAPMLNTTAGSADLGRLTWDNFDNFGNHVAFGGRVGFQPFPELEFGYGAQYSDVTPTGLGANTVNALLQSVDASYIRESRLLQGTINLKAQWVWSKVGDFRDPTAASPDILNNRREGGYLQFAYRPTLVSNSIIKNLEAVVRGDLLNQGNTAAGYDERRLTFGLNYWLTPTSVCKVAYGLDHQRGISAAPHDTLMVQFATGF